MTTSGGHDPPTYWDTWPKRELDDLELKILIELCAAGKSRSSVILTADLYGTTADVQENRPLEWTLVEALLQDLNLKGFVTYRLGTYDVFVQIRPTRKAYETLRVTRRWVTVVGPTHTQHPIAEKPLRPGDTTDFRGYAFRAKAMGPVIVEDFIDHCSACEPDHFDRHRVQLKEMYGTDKV